jgi:hypothetical protein
MQKLPIVELAVCGIWSLLSVTNVTWNPFLRYLSLLTDDEPSTVSRIKKETCIAQVERGTTDMALIEINDLVPFVDTHALATY